MAELSDTPSANRVRIAFFGLRNAGKSTLVNAIAGQEVAIVSDTPGTTTDPVSKAMEILPLGPCLITDTAGLDDVGALGAERVRRTLDVLSTADVAVWVDAGGEMSDGEKKIFGDFAEECRRRSVEMVVHRRGETAQGLLEKLSSLKVRPEPGLLDGLVSSGDRVVCVCPIDESAPKGRLILPQVQVLRACLDVHATCAVCQPEELAGVLATILPQGGEGCCLVITDSQAFSEVAKAVGPFRPRARITSFSMVFARQKGDLAAFMEGLRAASSLKDGDTVLVAEGCTHHRQCNDIGTVKIPAALSKLCGGKRLSFVFSSGGSFPVNEGEKPSLVVHCGACMLTRRAVLRRVESCRLAGVPVVNYGMVLAAANGLDVQQLCSVLCG